MTNSGAITTIRRDGSACEGGLALAEALFIPLVQQTLCQFAAAHNANKLIAK
jgi:hypothetical protein